MTLEQRKAIWASDLYPEERLIALAVSELMDFDQADHAWPGNARLAEMTGYNEQESGRILADLQEAGWFTRNDHPHCLESPPDGDERCDRPKGHRGHHEAPAIEGRHRWPA